MSITSLGSKPQRYRAISTTLPGKLEPTALGLLFSDQQRHHLNNMIPWVRGDDIEYDGLCIVVHLARLEKVIGLGFPRGRAPALAVMRCMLFSRASAPS